MKRARAMEEGVARLEALGEKQEADDGGEVTVVGFVGGVGVAAADGGGDGEEDDEAGGGGDGGDEVEVICGLEASPGPLVVSIQCLHQAANRDPHSFVWRRSH